MTPARLHQRALIAGVTVAGVMLVHVSGVQAQYQPRRTVASRPAGGAVPAGADQRQGADGMDMTGALRVRKLLGVGRQTQVKTPKYQTSVAKSVGRVGEWVQIEVIYDTAPEWIDSLTVQYQVLALTTEGGQRAYSLYRQSVEYVDIEKGREHTSKVYINPKAVMRYGLPVAVHVDVLINGQIVATEDDIDPRMKSLLPASWWTSRDVLENANLKVRPSYLLNRNQTPFAFINVDDHEVIR